MWVKQWQKESTVNTCEIIHCSICIRSRLSVIERFETVFLGSISQNTKINLLVKITTLTLSDMCCDITLCLAVKIDSQLRSNLTLCEIEPRYNWDPFVFCIAYSFSNWSFQHSGFYFLITTSKFGYCVNIGACVKIASGTEQWVDQLEFGIWSWIMMRHINIILVPRSVRNYQHLYVRARPSTCVTNVTLEITCCDIIT